MTSRTISHVLLGVGTSLALLATTTVSAAADGPEQITNGTFDAGMTGWNAYPAAQVVDGRGCVDVPAGTGPYGAGILQKVPLLAGETYALSLEALASPATSANVRLIVQGGPDVNYKQFLPAQKLALTPAPTTLSYTFTPDIDYANAELGIQQDVGNSTAYRVCIDDVSLKGGAEEEPYVPDTGPAVRVNQVGYHPDGPKVATVVSDATEPLRWELRDAARTVVTKGDTVRRGVDPSAGINVHTADFTRTKATGTGFTLAVGDEVSHPFAIDANLFDDLRTASKTFYYTNRSGIAIDDALAPGYGREAGHLGVEPNTGDTAVPCQQLGDDSQKLLDQPWTCEGTHDVRGGWYDAGDHGKYVVNAGISAAQLLMEYERNPQAYTDAQLSIPEAGNGTPDLLDEVRWELEWMLRMQVTDGDYAGMAYHKVADVDWTGLPLLPSEDPQQRVLYRPSTAATLNLAAASAQGARLFERFDAAFAHRLLSASRTAYAAAQRTPDLYAPAPNPAVDPNPGSGPYNDSDVSDEQYWAATELFLTTGENAFLRALQTSPKHRSDVFTEVGFDWGHVAPLARLQLATVESDLPKQDLKTVQHSVVKAADRYLADTRQPFGQAYGADQYVWGSNSQILNNMQVIGTAYDLTGRQKYAEAVLRSWDYVFGRNALNLSYVTGYGDVDVHNQHSRWYANQVDPSLPNPPRGTLSGGPNSTAVATGDPVAAAYLDGCVDQFCFIDDIGSWSTNEITINWNASLSWVSGFVADLAPRL